MMKKLISMICVVTFLLAMMAFPVSAATTTWESESYWVDYELKNTPDYSFAVVGDIQAITEHDVDNGHRYTQVLFDWILNNRKSRNIQYVFGLGDSINTVTSYPEESYNTSEHNPAEWKIAGDQYARLNGVIPYLAVRGNHDDVEGYHSAICTTDYQKQMTGFFYDSTNPTASGNSMSNSYRKITIGEEKYLMLGLDYNIYNNSAVRNWANEVIAANPDYKVIVSIHAYLSSGGALLNTDIGEAGTNKNDGNEWTDFEYFSATQLWDGIFSKHANIAAILCGHVSVDQPVITTRTGNNGNKVIEILVDPQDTDEYRYLDGIRRCGFVFMINVSNNGNTFEFEYISTTRSALTDEYYNGSNAFHLKSFQNSSAVTQTVTAKVQTITDFEPLVKELGIPSYVGEAMTTSPKLDGVVNEREYSYRKYYDTDELIGYDSSILQSGITEYIAHDADYIYYAVSMVQEKDNLGFQFQFNPLSSFNIFNDKTNLRNTLFQRVSIQLRYQSDGSVELFQAPTWNYSMSGTLPVVGKDLTYAATKTADNVKTYEIKISKDYLAAYNFCSKEDIKVVPYMTHQHSTSSIAHNYTQEEVNALTALGATRAELGSAPAFMILEEDPNGIETAITPETQETASTRISAEKSGLRFKTSILKADLEDLIYMLGAENISVGTLIAPTDKLGSKALTHEFGVSGKDYLDVKASIGTPFAEENGYLIYAGTISNIKRANLDRDFTAVGYISYVKKGVTYYIYTDTPAVRNIDYVATAAMKDPKNDYSSNALKILEKLTVKYHTDIEKDPFVTDPF